MEMSRFPYKGQASFGKSLHGHMHEPLHHGNGPNFPLQIFGDLIDLVADLLRDKLFKQMVRVLRCGHDPKSLLRG